MELLSSTAKPESSKDLIKLESRAPYHSDDSDDSSLGLDDDEGDENMIDTTEHDNNSARKMMSGFKNLICPLCLNFMYKSTTTVCGHSFCERCLDEYLILRKVSLT